MSDDGKNQEDPRGIPVPRENEAWLNEGGRARPPEGWKIRGPSGKEYDANELLDKLDMDGEPPRESEGDAEETGGGGGAEKADDEDAAQQLGRPPSSGRN